ncbi:MAG: hypothetical protein KGS45_08410 [Planctomycetes bacterium]|nr:hypothetical protein [Planctomycetota bacterium]
MRHYKHTHRGSVYLVVLSTTMLVTSLALLGVEAQRGTARSVELQISSAKTRALAQTALELALQTLNDQDWRDDLSSGDVVVSLEDGAGNAYKVTVTDPVDGDLSDDEWDSVELRIKAGSGDASQAFSTRLQPTSIADAALSYGMFAGGMIEFNSVTFNSTRAVYALGNVTALRSSVYGGVGTAGVLTGATFFGATRQGLATEKATDETVIDPWKARATVIDYTDIPSRQIRNVPSRQIRNVAIGPGVNPYGSKTTNPSGIYAIDCNGGNLDITNCRIVGTLIVTNCAALRITGSVSIQAPSESQPTLLTNAHTEISMSNIDLSELTSLTNFNPSGAANGAITDIDILDAYPSRINGIVYTSSTLQLGGTSRLVGVVIAGGDIKVTSNVGLSYNSAFAANPPEGFKSPGPLAVTSGSVSSTR